MPKKVRTCPRCGSKYSDYPALSRRDNKAYICSDCGVDEAMLDCGLRVKPAKTILSTWKLPVKAVRRFEYGAIKRLKAQAERDKKRNKK